MLSDTLPSDKQSLRKRCLAARAMVNEADAQAAGVAISAFLLQLIPAHARIVAGYRAIRGETDITPALTQLAARGHTLCLPITSSPNEPLIFRHWQQGAPLEKGAHGIEIPAQGDTLIPDAIIVPLVGFDAQLHRLGYGAGYYDRTIEALRKSGKSVLMVGVAFGVQQVEQIPALAHDQRLDAVVTEKGIILLSS